MLSDNWQRKTQVVFIVWAVALALVVVCGGCATAAGALGNPNGRFYNVMRAAECDSASVTEIFAAQPDGVKMRKRLPPPVVGWGRCELLGHLGVPNQVNLVQVDGASAEDWWYTTGLPGYAHQSHLAVVDGATGTVVSYSW